MEQHENIEGVWNKDDFKDYSPDKLAASIKAEKPKRSKPRKVIRELSFRLGKFQVELTIWKWRK